MDAVVDASRTSSEELVHSANGTTLVLMITTLAGILCVSLMLLFLGERLVKASIVSLALFGTFMACLSLGTWAFATVSVEFLHCTLPVLLALVLAVSVAVALGLVMEEHASTSAFIAGAAVGAFGMYMIRVIIIATAPEVASSNSFNLYWLVLLIVSIACGVLAFWFKTLIMLVASCLVGGCGVALSVYALIPVCGGPDLPSYAFFLIFGISMIIGALFQIHVTGTRARPRPNFDGGNVLFAPKVYRVAGPASSE
jgi:hypothetical protein